MTEEAIPFINAMSPATPELGGGSPTAHNVLTLGNGSLVRRPGLKSYFGAPATAIHGSELVAVYEAMDGKLFAVGRDDGGQRPIYHVTPGGAVSLGVGEAFLTGTLRPVIAETEMILAIAGGYEIEMVILGWPSAQRLSAGDSPKASHVLANKLRLVANDMLTDRTIVQYSAIASGDTFPGMGGITGHTQWYLNAGAGYFTAEARPDPVVALADTSGEILVFGTSTVQVYAADETLVWAPVGTIEAGCAAPYSVIKHRGLFFWLDHRRRFVVGEGTSVKEISQPIQSELDALASIDDCWGFTFQERNVVCLVWVFPAAGVAYAFQEGAGWSRWTGWTAGNWSPLMVACHHQRFAGAENIVGTTDGRVSLLTLTANDDHGAPIRAYVETGYNDHGTSRRKHTESVSFRFRRGEVASATGPQAYFGFRDRPGAWAARIPIDLGATGDTEVVVQFFSLGSYRTRQWFFEFSGSERIELLGATETFDVDP